MKKTKLWSGVTAVTATVLCVACVGSSVCYANEGTVNDMLNVTLSQVVKGEGAENENTNYYPTSFGNGEYTKANLDLMRAAAKEQNVNEMREGAALLYNPAATLPLKMAKKVSVFGRAAADTVYQGRAAGQKVTSSTVDKTDLKGALEKADFEVNETIWNSLAAQEDTSQRNRGCFGGKAAGSGSGELDKAFYDNAISSVGEYADAAIVVISRVGAEGTDMSMQELDDDGTTTVSSLALHKNERDMLEAVKTKFGKEKVVVLLNCGNAMEVEEIKEYCGAIMYIGTPGAYGFEGVAEILRGTVNPSGHLVDTYAVNSLSAPACVNSGTETPKFTNADAINSTINTEGYDERGEYMSFQAESIYIGYRYYETRYYDSIANPASNASTAEGASNGATSWKYENEISYPFGYGLSYTTFSQEIKDIKYNADDVVLTVEVKNEGSVAGKSVVQVYAQTPYGNYEKQNKVEKSAVELVGFAKTKELSAGATDTVTVTIDKYLLASYDYVNAQGYIMSEGEYYFAIGNDAHDALNNILTAQNHTTGLVTEDGTAATPDGSSKKVRTVNWGFDGNKYKMSTEGTRVTNQFADCDLNSWVANSGKYLSRSDWKATYPTTKTAVAASAEMMKILSGEIYETPENAPSYDSVASQFGKDEGITLVMMKDVAYEDQAMWRKFVLQATLEEIVTATGEMFTCQAVGSLSPAFTVGDGCDGIETGFAGGVINIYTTSGTTIPHTDAEGKNDDTVAFSCNTVHYCGNPILTGTFNTELYAGRGKMTGEEGLWTRAMELYDTGLDLHRTPFGGRSFEYKTECPTLAYLASIPQVTALEATGTHSAPKHFTGNDQEFYRDGLTVFFNEQAFRQGSLRAFEGALKVAKAGGLMQSFSRLGLNFSSASYALNTSVLRNEWGWTGNVVTDATPYSGGDNMKGYRNHALATFHAGSQQYCFDAAGNHAKAAIAWAKAHDDGHILECIIQSAIDWEHAIVNSVVINGMSSTDKIVSITPWWKTAFTAVISVLGVLTAASAAMLVFATVKEKKEDN